MRDAHLPDFQEGSDGLKDDDRNQDFRKNLAEQVGKFILEIAGKDIDDDDDDRIGNKQRLHEIVCPEFPSDVPNNVNHENQRIDGSQRDDDVKSGFPGSAEP